MKFKYFLYLILIFSTYSCASKKEKKIWTPEIDQLTRDSTGRINYARTHYQIARTKPMNRQRKNKVLALMRNTCPNKEFALIRSYRSESDFVTLKYDYRGNAPVFVYEFKCRN